MTSRSRRRKRSLCQSYSEVYEHADSNHTTLRELIDHIDVYEVQGTGKNKTQRLVIYYMFVGYLDIDPTQYHPNYTADIREGVAVEYVSCGPSEGLKELFPEQYGVEDDSFEEEETEQA